MLSALTALALALQVAPSEDLGETDAGNEAAKEKINPAELKRIFVKDSDAAQRAKVQHPLQLVCVRRLLPGSRVKAQTVCQDKAAWKAYTLSQDAAFYEWDSAQRGLDVQ